MDREIKLGIFYTTFAYLLWGFLPIFWKQLDHVDAGQILAHRIIWSFVFMIIIVFVTKNWSKFVQECKTIWKRKKKLVVVMCASLIISVNWLLFIVTVNAGHVLQASLGYYINPL